MTTVASGRVRNHSMLKHSSRNFPLKLSSRPFCHGNLARACIARLPDLAHASRPNQRYDFVGTLGRDRCELGQAEVQHFDDAVMPVSKNHEC
jgi:hypothetical protein